MFSLFARIIFICGVFYIWDAVERRYRIRTIQNDPVLMEGLQQSVALHERVSSRFREARYVYLLAHRKVTEACKTEDERAAVRDIDTRFLAYTHELSMFNTANVVDVTAALRKLTNELMSLNIYTQPLPLATDEDMRAECFAPA